MNPLVKKYGVKFGLIIASISILYYTTAYMFDEQLFVNFMFGTIMMIAFFVLLILSVVSVKKEQGGFVSFKDAFSVFTFSWIVVAVVTLCFNLLLFHMIDPDLGVRLKEMILDKTIGMMERFNSPEEAIDKAIEKMENTDQYAVSQLIKGSAMSILFASIFGLIVAAFMKKPKPVFEESTIEE